MSRSIIDKLTKILDAEASKGYTDSVVIGGLEAFVRAWASEVDQAEIPGPHKASLLEIAGSLAGYSQLDTHNRRQSVAQAKLAVSLLATGANQPKMRVVHRGEALPAIPLKPVSTRPERSTGVSSTRLVHASTKRNAHIEISPDSPLTKLPSIGPARAKLLSKLGIMTVGDLLRLYPNRHIDYSKIGNLNQLQAGELVSARVTVESIEEKQTSRRPIYRAILVDEFNNRIEAVWFNRKLVMGLEPGTEIIVSGRIKEFIGFRSFTSPSWERADREGLSTGRLVPVYPSKEEFGSTLTQGHMRRILRDALDASAHLIRETLPLPLMRRNRLMSLSEAIQQYHYPDSLPSKNAAHRRLAFEEFLVIQVGALRIRHQWRMHFPGQAIEPEQGLTESFMRNLPFELTGAQIRAADDMLADMAEPTPMRRLLQGDVGSGKTVVACVGLLAAVSAGYQGAIMVPTEILAAQHFENISNLVSSVRIGPEKREVNVVLLTGNVTGAQRKAVYKAIADGEADIIIGTHALIQENVEFHRLGLVIVDEQHRFGVVQREVLKNKGFNPHLLVMSATPIPRSLALTIYGDLDISILNELPPGRQRIKTRWLEPQERQKAYNFVRKQVGEGHQVFVICPLVEESEKIEARAATAEYERLQGEVFPDLRVGLVHGRMKPSEKADVMEAFHDRELDILVSTSVVEVGIDVPNATVMMVEGADRFGLSQLHQFRGRVGRGDAQSYCMLLADATSENSKDRLQIIEQTDDGFRLAEEDLRLRGPGEFFGTRQSGLPDLRVATFDDMDLLEAARKEATSIIKQDPDLESPELRELKKQVDEFWSARDNGTLGTS